MKNHGIKNILTSSNKWCPYGLKHPRCWNDLDKAHHSLSLNIQVPSPFPKVNQKPGLYVPAQSIFAKVREESSIRPESSTEIDTNRPSIVFNGQAFLLLFFPFLIGLQVIFLFCSLSFLWFAFLFQHRVYTALSWSPLLFRIRQLHTIFCSARGMRQYNQK